MNTLEVDVAIIGAGTAGLTARRAALKHGAERIVVIEGGPYGTMCARVGCMPSKVLIAAADAAHAVQTADTFGIRVPSIDVDGPAVMERVRALRDRFAGGVVSSVERWPPEQRLRGWARFVGPTSLEVDDHTRVEAHAIVIAAGTSPFTPRPLRNLGDRVLTTDEIFELPDLPRSLAVVGAGSVGLEIGQAMHRLGVRTTLFDLAEQLGPLRDPDLSAEARRVLGASLDLRLGVEISGANRTGDGIEIHWTDPEGREQRASFDLVLSAAGRRPNLERLNLGAAEIDLDEDGLPRFDHRTMQCGDRPIFIAGDFDGEREVLHEAADEGRYAGANAATYPKVRAHRRKIPVAIVFSDPQMAVVGTPGARPDCEVAYGDVDYGRQGRARVIAQNAGMVRIWAECECGYLTGAEMFGPRVEHTAHLLAWAIQQDMTVDAAVSMPFYHPVVEEGIRTALADLAAKLKLRPTKRPLDCGPGD